jgi:hypothetical protein
MWGIRLGENESGNKHKSDLESKLNSQAPPASSLCIAATALGELSGWERANPKPLEELSDFK